MSKSSTQREERFEAVQRALTGAGLTYVADRVLKLPVVAMPFQADGLECDLLVHCGDFYITVVGVVPLEVPPERLDAVLRELNERNGKVPIGGYEVLNDRVRWKYGLLAMAQLPTDDDIVAIVKDTFESVEEIVPVVRGILADDGSVA